MTIKDETPAPPALVQGPPEAPAPRTSESLSIQDVTQGLLRAAAVRAEPEKYDEARVAAADAALLQASGWAINLTHSSDGPTRRHGEQILTSLRAEDLRFNGELERRAEKIREMRVEAARVAELPDPPDLRTRIQKVRDNRMRSRKGSHVGAQRLMSRAIGHEADALEEDTRGLWAQSQRLWFEGAPVTDLALERDIFGKTPLGKFGMDPGIAGTNATMAAREGWRMSQVLSPDNPLQEDEYGRKFVVTSQGRIDIPDFSDRRNDIREGLLGHIAFNAGVNSNMVAAGLAERAAGAIAGGKQGGAFGAAQGFFSPEDVGVDFGIETAAGLTFPVVPRLFDGPGAMGRSARALKSPAAMRGIMEIVRDMQAKGELRPTMMEAMTSQLGSLAEFIVVNHAAGLGLKAIGSAGSRAAAAAGMKQVPMVARTARAWAKAINGGVDGRRMTGLQFDPLDVAQETFYGWMQAISTGDRSGWEGARGGLGEGLSEVGLFTAWRFGKKQAGAAFGPLTRKLAPETMAKLDALKVARQRIHDRNYYIEQLDTRPFKNSPLRDQLNGLIGEGQAAETISKGMDAGAVYSIFGMYQGAVASVTPEVWDSLNEREKLWLIMQQVGSPEALGGAMAAVAGVGMFYGLEKANYGKWRELNVERAKAVDGILAVYTERILNPTPEFAVESFRLFDAARKADPQHFEGREWTNPWGREGSLREIEEVQPERSQGENAASPEAAAIQKTVGLTYARPPKTGPDGEPGDRRSSTYREEQTDRFDAVELDLGEEGDRKVSWVKQLTGYGRWWQHAAEPSVGVRRRSDGTYVVVEMTDDPKTTDQRLWYNTKEKDEDGNPVKKVSPWYEDKGDALAFAHEMARQRADARAETEGDESLRLDPFESGKVPAADMSQEQRDTEVSDLGWRLSQLVGEGKGEEDPRFGYARRRLEEMRSASLDARGAADQQGDQGPPPDPEGPSGGVPGGGDPAGTDGSGGAMPVEPGSEGESDAPASLEDLSDGDLKAIIAEPPVEEAPADAKLTPRQAKRARQREGRRRQRQVRAQDRAEEELRERDRVAAAWGDPARKKAGERSARILYEQWKKSTELDAADQSKREAWDRQQEANLGRSQRRYLDPRTSEFESEGDAPEILRPSPADLAVAPVDMSEGELQDAVAAASNLPATPETDAMVDELELRTNPTFGAESEVEYEAALGEAGRRAIEGVGADQLDALYDEEIVQDLEDRGLDADTTLEEWDSTVQDMVSLAATEEAEAAQLEDEQHDPQVSLDAHRYDPGLAGRSDGEKIDAIQGLLPFDSRSQAEGAEASAPAADGETPAQPKPETIDRAAAVKQKLQPPPPSQPKKVRALSGGTTPEARLLQAGEAIKRLRELAGQRAPEDYWALAMGATAPGIEPNNLYEAQQVARDLFSFLQMAAHEGSKSIFADIPKQADATSEMLVDYFDVLGDLANEVEPDADAAERLMGHSILQRGEDGSLSIAPDAAGNLKGYMDLVMSHLMKRAGIDIPESLFAGLDPSLITGPLRAVQRALGRAFSDPEIEGNEMISVQRFRASHFQDTVGRYLPKPIRDMFRVGGRIHGRLFDSFSLPSIVSEMNRRALYEVYRKGEYEAGEVAFETGVILSGVVYEGGMRTLIEHQEGFTRIIGSGAMRTMTGPADVEKMLGPGTAYLWGNLVRMNELIGRIGRRMVEVDYITEGQRKAWEGQYALRAFADLSEEDAYERLREGEGVSVLMPNRDLARGFEAKSGAVQIYNPEYVFTRQNNQEAFIVRMFSMLQGLADGGMAVPADTVKGWDPWVKEHWLQPAIKGDVKSKAADVSDPINGRRATGTQMRLFAHLEGFRTNMQSERDALAGRDPGPGQHPWTPGKQKVLDDYIGRPATATEEARPPQVAITQGMSDSLGQFLDQFEQAPTTVTSARQAKDENVLSEYAQKRMEEVARHWKRAATVQNPVHWTKNIVSSVLNNHQMGAVSLQDFIKSIITGRGHYADAMYAIDLFDKYTKAGRPEGWGNAQERQVLHDVQVVLEEIMGSTFVHNVIEAPGIQNVIGAGISRDAVAAALELEVTRRGDPGATPALLDAVGEMGRRISQSTGQNDIEVAKGLGSQNPERVAEALKELTNSYQQWELLFKLAGTLNRRAKNPPKKGQSRDDWTRHHARYAVVPTGEYANTSPVLRRWQALQFGNTNPNSLTAKTTRGTGAINGLALASGRPFAMYDTVTQIPLLRGMVSHPLRAIGGMGIAILMKQAIMAALQESDEEHWQKYMAIAGGERHEGSAQVPQAAMDLLEKMGEQYLPAPGGFVGTLPRDFYRAFFRHFKQFVMGEGFTVPTLSRNGRTRYTDLSPLAGAPGDVARGYRHARNVAASIQNPGRALLDAFQGFYPAAWLSFTQAVLDVASPGDRTAWEAGMKQGGLLAGSLTGFVGPRGLVMSRQGQRLDQIGLLYGQSIVEYMRGQVVDYHPGARQQFVEWLASSTFSSEYATSYDRLREPDGMVVSLFRELLPHIRPGSGVVADRYRRAVKLVQKQGVNVVRDAYNVWRSNDYGFPAITTLDGILAEKSNVFPDIRWNEDRKSWELKPDHEPKSAYARLASKQAGYEEQAALLDVAVRFVSGPAWRTRGRDVVLGKARDRAIDPEMLTRYYEGALADPNSRGMRIFMYQDLIVDKKTSRTAEFYPLFAAIGRPRDSAEPREKEEYYKLWRFFDKAGMHDVNMPPEPGLQETLGVRAPQAGYKPIMRDLARKRP